MSCTFVHEVVAAPRQKWRQPEESEALRDVHAPQYQPRAHPRGELSWNAEAVW